ncbi:hypothetical protein [Methylobacterium nodulans]|uniref:Uncharacterized protein n=1 Tax=Methylobacterium nodulans (strain LMG 21967 / CNCM I-2342 / ORS 2060) TaxID=460265 RepID=B8IQR8_METNO|nr:hypothetical protein [Methylobacterium nodulans]ACL62363.1 conserved hypothetical protein [Methylobacterium nodulans ORS 2060]
MASTESFDIVAEFDVLLFEAGSVWDVRDRDANWELAASFVVEQQARACTEELNGLEGRERFKVVKRGTC